MKDPTDPIRLKASQYPDVDEGTACTQSSFKTGGKSFLFIGEQGGRYKAMFKLNACKPEAAKLAKKEPENYQAATGDWVTARFCADHPMPKAVWRKWLDESYQLSQSSATKKAASRTRAKSK